PVRFGDIREPGAVEARGAVDDDVEPAQLALDARDHVIDVALDRNVCAHGERSASALFDFADSRSRIRRRFAVVDDDVRTGIGEGERDRFTNASCTACDEGYFPGR